MLASDLVLQDRARAALRLTHQFAIHPWSVQQELDGLVRLLDEQPTVVGGAKAALGSLIAAAKAKRGPQVES